MSILDGFGGEESLDRDTSLVSLYVNAKERGYRGLRCSPPEEPHPLLLLSSDMQACQKVSAHCWFLEESSARVSVPSSTIPSSFFPDHNHQSERNQHGVTNSS